MRGKVLELEVEIAEKKGYAEGVSVGKSEGISQGILTGVIRGRVQALYADAGFSIEQIVEKVGVSIEDVTKILQELKLLPGKEKSSAS